MEPTYPLTREHLRNYILIHKDDQRNKMITRGIDFVSKVIIDTAFSHSMRIYNPQIYANGCAINASPLNTTKYNTSCEFLMKDIRKACLLSGYNVS